MEKLSTNIYNYIDTYVHYVVKYNRLEVKI